MLESHKSPVVSIQMWVRTGSADEKRGEEGISHFIEHLVFKGTKKFKVGEIASTIEGAGGELNAYTSFDQTVFHVTISKQFVDTGLLAISEMMGFPVFDSQEIDNEREVVIEEIKRGQDSLGRRASQLLFSTVYQKHPYGIPVIGFEKNIRKISSKKILSYFNERYVPRNMFLVVAGDFNSDDMKLKVKENFSAFVDYKIKKISRAKEPTQKTPRVKVQNANFEQSVGYLAWRAPGLMHKDTPALDVLSMILGQGDSSRLVKKLRIEKPTVNSIGASVFAPEEQGLFTISMGYQKENLEQALRGISEVLLEILQKPFEPDEIESAVLSLETEKFYSVETVDGLARSAGSQEFSARNLNFQDKYLKAVRKIRAPDLVRVAKKYLKIQTVSAAFITNASSDATKKLIMKELKYYSQQNKKQKKSAPKSVPPKFRSLKSDLGESKSDLERMTLPNGVRLLFYPSKETHLISVKAAFLGGLRNETDDQGGLTEHLSRVWMGGVPGLSESEINKKLDAMAASISPIAGRNSIGLGASFLSAFETGAADLFLKILAAPTFPEEVLDREKTLSLEEIKTKNDNPSSIAGREFMSQIFAGHPYGRDMLGDTESVKRIVIQDIRRHWTKISQRKNLTVVVAGNFNRDNWIRWISEQTKSLGPGSEYRSQFPIQKIERPIRTFKESKKEQSHVMIGFRGLTISDPERYTLQIMQSILAGQGGRLFLELRDKNSLAYSVSPMRMEGLESGYFGAYIGCSPEKVNKALTMLSEQFQLLVNTPVGQEELLRAQRYLVGRHDIDLQSVGSIASSILYDEIYGNDAREGLDVAKKYFAVTAARVQALAQKVFSQQPVITVVGPMNPWS